MNFRVCMISVYLANAQATRIKVNIEPSLTQRVRATLACPKMPTMLLHQDTEFAAPN